MLNIAICDDDIQTTGRMDMLLQEIAKQNFMDVEIEVFWNGESLADAVAQGTYFDMIYLDIEMDKEDGISAAKRIREYDKNTLIIYLFMLQVTKIICRSLLKLDRFDFL